MQDSELHLMKPTKKKDNKKKTTVNIKKNVYVQSRNNKAGDYNLNLI